MKSLLTLTEYHKMAKYQCIKRKIPASDENVGEIATALMTADHKYNDSIGSLEGFRDMYAMFTAGNIKRKFTRWYKKHRQEPKDYNLDQNLSKLINFESKEFLEHIRNFKLTNQQHTVIHLKYWLGLSLKDISGQLNVSHQRVSIIHQEAIERIKHELVQKPI